MVFAFVLLAASMGAAWLPDLLLTGARRLSVWLPLLILAVASGLAFGLLLPVSLLPLAVLVCAAWLASRPDVPKIGRQVSGAVVLVIAFALGTHKLPGFNNPLLLDHVRFAPDSAPFTLYANFDKGAVGVVLLALLNKRTATWLEFALVMRRTLPIVLLTTLVGVLAAWALGFAHLDLKFPPATLLFLSVNLVLTVVAEEAYFRGFIQDRLAIAFGQNRWGAAAAVILVSAVFGLAHGGFSTYSLLATLAGLGYGLAYQDSRRIEGAIVCHFILNSVHFLTLSYPFAQ